MGRFRIRDYPQQDRNAPELPMRTYTHKLNHTMQSAGTKHLILLFTVPPALTISLFATMHANLLFADGAENKNFRNQCDSEYTKGEEFVITQLNSAEAGHFI